MFRLVDTKAHFPQMEEGILSFWREGEIFRKSVEDRPTAPLYVFYEGPPTANGSPGIHHVLARVFKDVVLRYWSMRGYRVPRKGGWDTHGLPVELEVERELGITSKPQIEEYGIARFNQACRESVFRYVKDWEVLTERIAFWIDMQDPYVTCDNTYIEACWWIIKTLWDQSLIYQDYRVTPHCPRCGTSLSDHEVALGYRDDAVDPSVYVKFPLDTAALGGHPLSAQLMGEVPTFFLAWTTTPWTLQSNVALAVAPEARYALAEAQRDGGVERYILAEALLESTLRERYRVLASWPGLELLGLYYRPLYQAGLVSAPPERPPHRVVTGDFVSLTEGTGIVHINPAYGEVDLQVGRSNGLPLVHTVALDGSVLPEFGLPGAGRFVKDADPLILEDLRARGLLYRQERITHTYPFCWRCETPLLYYAKSSWYIRTTAKKEGLLQGNERINWYPGHIKRGRFGDWLANNVDWAISRERYWGTPLPIWRCEGCGAYECLGSVAALEARSGRPGLAGTLDLHRPFVDQITLPCPQCSGTMRRIPEVIDCWFDSGAVPVAAWGHLYAGKTAQEARDLLQSKGQFPAHFICEAIDQTRGWFYSLHAVSTLLFDQPCFRNVICLGHILDAKGEKMSKSRGNVVEPWMVLNQHGADALRWYLYTATPAGNPRRFSADLVAEALRQFLLTLWNTYGFFVLYANLDRWTPVAWATADVTRSELDRWIRSRLHQLIGQVTDHLDHYNPTDAGRAIQDFVNELSNWYVRRSRRRFWKSENDADKQAAYLTLHECLVTLAKLLAPLTPFVAEEMYQNLVRSVDPAAPESVHLCSYPAADPALIDEQLVADTALVMKMVSLGRAARSKANLRVRQPLAQLLVKPRTSSEGEALRRLSPQLLEELNVKELLVVREEGELMAMKDRPGYSTVQEGGYLVGVTTELTPELREEGLARDLVHRLQTMRRSAGFDIADRIVIFYQAPPKIEAALRRHQAYVKTETLALELRAATPPAGAYQEEHRIERERVLLGVERVLVTS